MRFVATFAWLLGASAAHAQGPELSRTVLPNGLVMVQSPSESSRVGLCLVIATAPVADAKLEVPFGRALLDAAGGLPAALAQRGGRRHASVSTDRLEHCVEVVPQDARAAMRWLGAWFTRTERPAPNESAGEPSSDELGLRKLRALALHEPEPPRAAWSEVEGDWTRYRDETLTGSRAVLSVTGSVSEALVAELLSELARAPRGTRPAPPAAAKLRQTSERFMTVRDQRLAAPVVFYGWAAPSSSQADHRALQLIGLALAGSGDSTLARVLVKTRQVAKTAWVGLEDQERSNLFWLRFDVTPGLQVDRLAAPLTEIVRRVRLLGLTEQELEHARELARSSFERVRTDAGALALALARVELRTGDASDWFREQELLLQVTRDQTRDAAAALHEQRQSVVELHPRYYIDQPSTPDRPAKKPAARVHKVRRGDTLGQIAERYGVSLEALLRENKLQRRSLISPGQKLVIPAPPPARASSKR